MPAALRNGNKARPRTAEVAFDVPVCDVPPDTDDVIKHVRQGVHQVCRNHNPSDMHRG